MKNLKRILSVVLVVAMAFSLVTVASAADLSDKYSDAAQIKHTAAVDTLTELGVFQGVGNSTFRPEGILTRAQMVKIAAYVMVQREITDGQQTERALSLYASTVKFTDTEKGAWYMGPVGYAQARGVVAGNGMGTFSPNRDVTYAEAAKMLLVALGYVPEQAGLVGDDWISNTNRLANLNGLFDEIDAYDVNAKVTRDNMAQMVYNMLEEDVYSWTVNPTTGVWNSKNEGPAIRYYFGTNYSTVVEGVVVANSYANLGLAADQDTYETVANFADIDAAHGTSKSVFTFANALYNEEYATDGEGRDSEAVGSKVAINANTTTITYDPRFETVVYVPLAECYHEGNCSLRHNPNNPNCPRNTTNTFKVVKVTTGGDVIGQTVDMTFVGGGWEDYTYVNVAAKDTNNVEIIATKEPAPINATTNDVDIVEGTIYAEINTDNDQTAVTGTFTDVEVYKSGLPTSTYVNNTQYATKTAAQGLAAEMTDIAKLYVLTDNNGDGKAEYVIAIAEDFVISDISATRDVVLKNTAGGVYATAKGTELAKDSKALAYIALNGETAYEVLDEHAGKVTHVSNATGRIYFDDADEFNKASGVQHAVDNTSPKVTDAKTEVIGSSYTYYLDNAGNIVWIELAKDESVEALIYGVESTNNGTVTGLTSATAAKIYTINTDGEKHEYNIPKTLIGSGKLGPITVTGATTDTNYNDANYCKISIVGDNVTMIEDLDTNGQKYLLGAMAAGTTVTVTDDTAEHKKDTGNVGTTASATYLSDDTVIFNFVKKVATGLPVTQADIDNNRLILGDVTVAKGPTGVKDVVNRGTIDVNTYDAEKNDATKAGHGVLDVMVVNLDRDGSMVNVTNADTTEDTSYAIVRKIDVKNAKSSQHTLADGVTVKYTWDIPCVGDVSSITLGSDNNDSANIKLADASALIDKFASSDSSYIVLRVGPKDNGKTWGAPVDTLVDVSSDYGVVATAAYDSIGTVSADTSRVSVKASDGKVATLSYADDSIVLIQDAITGSLEPITFADALAKLDGVIYKTASVDVVASANVDTFANAVDVAIITLGA